MSLKVINYMILLNGIFNVKKGLESNYEYRRRNI